MGNVSLTPDQVVAQTSKMTSAADQLVAAGNLVAQHLEDLSKDGLRGAAGTALAVKAQELRQAAKSVAEDSRAKAQTVGNWGRQNVDMQHQQAAAANSIPA